MTLHLFRFAAIVPTARAAAMNTWLRINIDAAGGDWVVAKLSATGGAPYSHGLFSAALTAAELKLLMQRLCSLASLTPPANWDAMNRGERKAWILSQRAAIDSATGVYIQVSDNDGGWDRPRDALTAKNLRGRETL